MKKTQKNIGLDGVTTPPASCTDRHCVFHGHNTIHGNHFNGTVLKSSAQRTAAVGWDRLFYIPKFERYEKRRTKIQVHNPPCIDAKIGDKVLIVECKPISKTKTFVIVQKK